MIIKMALVMLKPEHDTDSSPESNTCPTPTLHLDLSQTLMTILTPARN